MKKALLISLMVIAIGAIGYYFIYRPAKKSFGPPSAYEIYLKAKEDYLKTWNGAKWDDWNNLDDDDYVRVDVIGRLLDAGQIKQSDLSDLTLSRIDHFKQIISGDASWMQAVRDKALQNGITEQEQLWDDAFYMAQGEGSVNIRQ